jgi:hypothetical protein
VRENLEADFEEAHMSGQLIHGAKRGRAVGYIQSHNQS